MVMFAVEIKKKPIDSEHRASAGREKPALYRFEGKFVRQQKHG
jgi:hypothetical protein